MVKKLIAWLMCAALLLSLLPMPMAFAEEGYATTLVSSNEEGGLTGDRVAAGNAVTLDVQAREHFGTEGYATHPETPTDGGRELFTHAVSCPNNIDVGHEETECAAFATAGIAGPLGVATGDILDLTATGALVLGEVTGDNGLPVTERGAVFSTNADPTVATGAKAPAVGAGMGAFSVTLTSLLPDTAYYVRTYAVNAGATAYGTTRRFTTPIRVTTVAVGILPLALAINGATNKVYVANNIGNSVSVIAGESDAVLSTIPVQKAPYGLAINEATNKIYVTNNFSNTVSVINGGTDAVVATIPAGNAARAVAVNERTNTVYVTNFMAASVSVIDGETNTVSATVSVGSRPIALAINETTNKVYVVNYYSDSVTVIDGTNNTVDATVTVGSSPRFAVINEATNKIYVVNYRGASVTVIDGEDNSVENVAVGSYPWAAAVNENTNKIYVPNGEVNVTVLDGATNATQVVTAGKAPQAVAVNDAANQIFVGNYNHDERSSTGFVVTRIDGQTLEKVGYAVSSNPAELMINPRTNKLYVVNVVNDGVTIISLSPTDITRFLPLIIR